jgi:hypothetical protein
MDPSSTTAVSLHLRFEKNARFRKIDSSQRNIDARLQIGRGQDFVSFAMEQQHQGWKGLVAVFRVLSRDWLPRVALADAGAVTLVQF